MDNLESQRHLARTNIAQLQSSVNSLKWLCFGGRPPQFAWSLLDNRHPPTSIDWKSTYNTDFVDFSHTQASLQPAATATDHLSTENPHPAAETMRDTNTPQFREPSPAASGPLPSAGDPPDATIERQARRPHSAPPGGRHNNLDSIGPLLHTGRFPLGTTEYRDRFRWWPVMGDHPAYVDQSGRARNDNQSNCRNRLYHQNDDRYKSEIWTDVCRRSARIQSESAENPGTTLLTTDSLNPQVGNNGASLTQDNATENAAPHIQSEDFSTQVGVIQGCEATQPQTSAENLDRPTIDPPIGSVATGSRDSVQIPASSNAQRATYAAGATSRPSRSTQSQPSSTVRRSSSAPRRLGRSRGATQLLNPLLSYPRYPHSSDGQIGRWTTEYDRAFNSGR